MTWQILADAFVVAWTVTWWFVGRSTDGVIRSIAAPSRQAAKLAEEIRGQTEDVASHVAGIPFVGKDLRQPFHSMAGTLDALGASAKSQAATIEQTATVVGVLTFLIPVALMLAIWLPRRLAFARRAAEVSSLIETVDGTDLLAMRALATQPVGDLRTVGADPVASWRAGDPHTLAALAELELIRSGVQRRRKRVTGSPTR